MIIPYQQLSDETLTNLIEEFVTRDGTDYGEETVSLAQKVDQVRGLLASGEAVILFSEMSAQCNIVRADSLD